MKNFKIGERLFHILGVIFDSRFWYRNYDVSHEWSDYLEAKMDKGEPVEVLDEYRCKLGNVGIWISNWPYAFGYKLPSYACKFLPRRKTVIRLRKYILSQSLKDLDDDND